MAHQVELAVDTDKLEATIRALYTPNGAVGPVPLSPYLEFHDPFVVKLPQVRRMFQKLHRWLPASEVEPSINTGRATPDCGCTIDATQRPAAGR